MIYIYIMYHCSGYFFFFFLLLSNFWMKDYSRDKPCEEAMTVTNSCIRPVAAGDLAGWAFWAKASLPQPISWRDFPSLGSNLRRCFCSWWPVPYFGSLSNWAVTNTFYRGLCYLVHLGLSWSIAGIPIGRLAKLPDGAQGACRSTKGGSCTTLRGVMLKRWIWTCVFSYSNLASGTSSALLGFKFGLQLKPY